MCFRQEDSHPTIIQSIHLLNLTIPYMKCLNLSLQEPDKLKCFVTIHHVGIISSIAITKSQYRLHSARNGHIMLLGELSRKGEKKKIACMNEQRDDDRMLC